MTSFDSHDVIFKPKWLSIATEFQKSFCFNDSFLETLMYGKNPYLNFYNFPRFFISQIKTESKVYFESIKHFLFYDSKTETKQKNSRIWEIRIYSWISTILSHYKYILSRAVTLWFTPLKKITTFYTVIKQKKKWWRSGSRRAAVTFLLLLQKGISSLYQLWFNGVRGGPWMDRVRRWLTGIPEHWAPLFILFFINIYKSVWWLHIYMLGPLSFTLFKEGNTQWSHRTVQRDHPAGKQRN